jgi:hypothetical protein
MIRRLRYFLAAALIAAVAGTAVATAGSTQVPILTGPMPLTGAGFGHIKPKTIYQGGDPTGLLCTIHWLSWGGPMAVGTGTGWYINSHQAVSQGKPAPAVVVLYHLGVWHGRRAYKRWTWYFPGSGTGTARPCRA